MKTIWKLIWGRHRHDIRLLHRINLLDTYIASGHQLDGFGSLYDFPRKKKWFWPFLWPETDQEYRKRLTDHIMGKTR